jgi:hypothetical protein
MQTIIEAEKSETTRTAILTDTIHNGNPVFKLEVLTEKTYFIPKDWFELEETIDCLSDMINHLKEQGFKIIDKASKQPQ